MIPKALQRKIKEEAGPMVSDILKAQLEARQQSFKEGENEVALIAFNEEKKQFIGFAYFDETHKITRLDEVQTLTDFIQGLINNQ